MARVLFRCDQCTYEEWRDASESVSLCPVCGYLRWEAVAAAEPEPAAEDAAPPPPTASGDAE